MTSFSAFISIITLPIAMSFTVIAIIGKKKKRKINCLMEINYTDKLYCGNPKETN